MPKSAKKRKDKAADFAKAKLKLGKEKKAPSNVIDTSFKARSIALPSQSIAISKDNSTPTTKKRLTVDDLLANLKHYSPGVKKDALLGLTELLEAHWSLLHQNLSRLINQLARIIGNEDSSVRKQLLSFLSWILPRVPKEDLIPHTSTLFLFTASAQTHIFPEIRIDAVRFLALFLEVIPEALVEGWDMPGPSHGKRILDGYLGNLNAGTRYGGTEGPATATSTSSVILSPSSKLAVLQSFAAFLRAGLSTRVPDEEAGKPLHAWFMSRSFMSEEAFQKFELSLMSSPGSTTEARYRARSCAWDEFDGLSLDHPLIQSDTSWTIQELDDVPSLGATLKGSSAESSTITFLLHLCRTMNPFLVSTILDCAPSVFAPDAKGNETEASTIVAVSQIASLLYGAILRGAESVPPSSLSDLETLLSYMTPYFPFTSSKPRDVKCFQDLNLIYCELTSLLLLRSNVPSKKSGQSLTPSKALMMQISIVSDYINKLLRSQSTSTSQIPHSLSAGTYLALLPSIWAIISNSYPELSSYATEIRQALLDHAVKTLSKSSIKRLTIEFVARLSLLETEPQYQGAFRIGDNDQARQQFQSWLIHLPQVLWEISNSDAIATEVILRFLMRSVQRRMRLVDSKSISALTARFVPYFSIVHPVRGQIPGPYRKLSLAQSHLRRLCLDMAATLLSEVDTPEARDALLKAVKSGVAGTIQEEYWAHVHV